MQKLITKKVDDIYNNHLRRKDLIGEEDECFGRTLIDYVLDVIPEIRNKIKKNEDAYG